MNDNVAPRANYERWIWIELIGFDNTQPDCGASQYLDKLGFVPDAISYLITSPDIVHQHESLENEKELPPDFCSYYGHEMNAERERQVWTNHQLRTLNEALQSRGIKVFLATFTTFLSNTFHPEWISEHPELLEVRRSGEINSAISPLKRFKNGTFYEDFFIPKLAQTLTDYNFDGWHAADGWGPARLPINEADFSDDTFEQFIAARNIQLPENIALRCTEYSQCQTRADWIWREKRREWILFQTDRWASFYQKKVAAIHAIGKEIVINSCWTRDPFEAIYRYGIDYRKLIGAGVDGIVTESAAGASDMEAEYGFRLENYVAALLLIRAVVPQTKLVFLHGVKDVMEQWDLIHHAPTILEKETLALANIYLQNENANLQRCADGLVVCLGDGISEEEWKWLQARWNLAFAEIPGQLLGATLLWSDAAFENELNDFIAHRNPTTHTLLYNLTERGAPIQSVVRIENLQHARGALLVLNAHLLPEDERAKVLSYDGGALILLERDEDGFRCFAPHEKSRRELRVRPEREYSQSQQSEPITFLENLPVNDLGETFIKDCARLIGEVSGAFQVASGEDFISLQAMKIGDKKVRVVLKNNRLAYSRPVIETERKIASLEIKGEFPYAQLQPDESRFSVKVPGRGATVLDVVFEDN